MKTACDGFDKSFENCISLNIDVEPRERRNFGIVIFFFLLFFPFSFPSRKLRGNLSKQGIAILFQVGESHFGPMHSNRGESLLERPAYVPDYTRIPSLLRSNWLSTLLLRFTDLIRLPYLRWFCTKLEVLGLRYLFGLPNIESLFVINSYQLVRPLITQ